MSYRIEFSQDTPLKPSTRQSSEINSEFLIPIAKGVNYPISSWSWDGLHIKFSLGKQDGKQLSFAGRNTWFAFGDHCKVTKNGEEVGRFLAKKNPNDYMKMVASGSPDIYTLFWIKNGKVIDRVYVCSGQRGLKPVPRDQDYSGSMRPCPPGEYKLGPVEEGSFGAAIGYYWISVYSTEPRHAIGIHEDANRDYAPGSAGCICPLNRSDMEAVAYWRRNGAATLIVDYGRL